MAGDDILDQFIADARVRAANGTADNVHWMALLIDRQCGKLDEITNGMRTIMGDRRLVLGALGLGGAGGGAAIAAAVNALAR